MDKSINQQRPLLFRPRVLTTDEALLALYKPAGLHVFGAHGSVWSWLAEQHPELAQIGPEREPAFVHRLDQGTSGLLLAARSSSTYQFLRTAFRSGRVAKTYLALAQGVLDEPQEVDAPLGGRYRRSKTVQVARENRRLHSRVPARSRIVPLATGGGWTLCRVDMHTGARHQIRAHLAHIGHPVAGDAAYGARSAPLDSAHFWLHAYAAVFEHPLGGHSVRLVCPLDEQRLRVLESVGIRGTLYPLDVRSTGG